RERAAWFAGIGSRLANALMVTLPNLGLVERGRHGRGKEPAWCFRLTPLGRAVFGAPEQPAPAEEEADRFLVLQPNFDVVAYLDRATVASVGLLGQLAEAPAGSAADATVVRTFRLTQGSVYQALENGLEPARIVEYLRRHGQNEPPANVLQTL